MVKSYTKKQITEAIAYWKKILEDMDAASKETIKIPKTSKEEEAFIKWADSKFDGSAYDKIVSRENEEKVGVQRDLDDFDEYMCSQQDAIDEDSFWESVFEQMHEDFSDNAEIQAEELLDWLWDTGQNIAEKAFEDFEPGQEFCTHVGKWKPEAYWRA